MLTLVRNRLASLAMPGVLLAACRENGGEATAKRVESATTTSLASPPSSATSTTPATATAVETTSSSTTLPIATSPRDETTGGESHTWTDYVHAGGAEGTTIVGQMTVQIACRLTGFGVANGNTWWYRIAQSPWNGAFYASADAFYNNGATSGPLLGTPYFDPAVPKCA